MRQHLIHAARLLPVVVAAVAGGFAARMASLPLAWTIGPLVVTAAAAMAGWMPRIPKQTRPSGQVIVAAPIGTAFTSAALASLLDHAGAMVAMAVLIIVTGLLVAAALSRAARIDPITACLACLPAGPVETANLAQRFGIPAGPVIFAQTLRITCVVLVIPPLVIAIEGTDLTRADLAGPAAALSPWHFALMAACLAGAILCRRLGVPNGHFLGAILVSAVVAASGFALPPFPPYVIATGQVMLGISLGAAFDRAQLRRAGSLLPALILATLGFVALCLGFGQLVAWLTGISQATMTLSAAPGSIAEMALTARLVHADATTVIAFNIVRIFIVIPAAGVLVALVRWMLNARKGAPAAPPSDGTP